MSSSNHDETATRSKNGWRQAIRLRRRVGGTAAPNNYVLNHEFASSCGRNAFKHFLNFVSHFLQCHEPSTSILRWRPDVDHCSNKDQVCSPEKILFAE